MKTVYCVLSVGSCENPVFLIVHKCKKQLKLWKEVGMVSMHTRMCVGMINIG